MSGARFIPTLCALLSLLATGCTAAEGRREAPGSGGRQLYKLQTELERRLKGTLEERKRYAAFFPLRVWLQMPVPSEREEWSAGVYLLRLIKYVEREQPRDALPLLRKLLSLDFDHIAKSDGAAPADVSLMKVYVRIATKDMKREEKARFLAGLLRPKNRLKGLDVVVYELDELGGAGKRAILEMLQEEAGTDVKLPGAAKCARAVKEALADEKSISDHELERLVTLAGKSDFAKLVTARYMVNRACLGFKADPRCVRFFRELWEKYPARTNNDKPVGVRAVIMESGGAICVPGNLKLLLHFLKSIDKEGPSRPGEVLRGSVLDTILVEVERHGRSVDRELGEYLTAFSRRRIDVDPKNFRKNRPLLKVADQFVKNQAKVLGILKARKARANN